MHVKFPNKINMFLRFRDMEKTLLLMETRQLSMVATVTLLSLLTNPT